MAPKPSYTHTHRKRPSALRLSSDTTHSLPLYVANADDRPPDYPDSADEADEESDPSDVPPPSSFSLSSPRRRPAQQQTHRRRHSSKNSNLTDPYLDSLLARSVHALEMSNTLLQSSMSTQTALSTLFADSPADEVLENSVRGLSTRIERRDAQPKWVDDLAEISRGVDGLLAEEQMAGSASTASSSMKQAYRHDGSATLGSSGSTLGAHASASSLNLSLHAPLSSPKITETFPEPATPAYNMLSTFVTQQRSPSASTSASSTPAARTSPIPALSNLFSISRRRPSIDQTSTSISPPTSFKQKSLSTTCASSQDRSLTLTPKQIHTALAHHRPMTPPAEESSSASSDGECIAKRTVLSLRKILDEQQAPVQHRPKRLRAPAFLPRTPAPAPEAGTSTATASISRLYTKGKHTSSTRPPSPPRQSAMKHKPQPQPLQSESLTPASASTLNSKAPSPSPSPSSPMAFHFPDVLGMRSWSSTSLRSLGGGGAWNSSSGRSTPKKISFAELPEAYKGSTSARFDRGYRRKRGKGKGKGKGRASGSGSGKDGDGEGEGEGGWWSTWFWGAGAGAGAGGSLSAREERLEERLGRSWGGRMPGAPLGFGPGTDDWAV